MKAQNLVRTPDPAPQKRPLLALEAQLAELSDALDHTIDDVHKSLWSAICDSRPDSAPSRGRGRPPKFTPGQRQILAVQAQFAKLRAEVEETLTIIEVQKGLRAL